ncbi:unnamed protein product, partial [Prorocentrum cordatum]
AKLDSAHRQQEDEFADIEALLVDKSAQGPFGNEEVVEETGQVEVLTATWKEMRQEINDARKTSIFEEADKLQIAFRRELEEAKRETRPGAHKASLATALQQLRARRVGEQALDIFFACPVDKGAVGPGCGGALSGADRLQKLKELVEPTSQQLEFYEETKVFRFGNSGREETGHIAAPAVRWDAPLLLSKPPMKALRARSQIAFDAPETAVELEETDSGNYMMQG